MARQALSNRVRKGTALTSPKLTRDFPTLKLRALEHEVFALILLDGRHRVIEYIELFRGTSDGKNTFLDFAPGRTRGTQCHCPNI